MPSFTPTPRISGLSQIAENYDAVLCDIWGVLHNGISAGAGAIEALAGFKKSGKPTFLLTNAPRAHGQVLKQLDKMHVPLDTTFDTIVTSGDVTRDLIAKLDVPVFHIGTPADRSIFEGLDVELVDWNKAGIVICTGLYDDFNEKPEDYGDLFANLKSRDLKFVCANPDIVVHHGGVMRWCAGALAREYEKIGGENIMIGKPHAPVYQHAHDLLNKAAGNTLKKSKILAIGDSINTDIAGALGYGLDVVYISAGIHAAEYGDIENPDEAKLQDFLQQHNSTPVAWMPHLGWN